MNNARAIKVDFCASTDYLIKHGPVISKSLPLPVRPVLVSRDSDEILNISCSADQRGKLLSQRYHLVAKPVGFAVCV